MKKYIKRLFICISIFLISLIPVIFRYLRKKTRGNQELLSHSVYQKICFTIHQIYRNTNHKYDKVLSIYEDFWELETMQQHDINLHYWISLAWHSIIRYWYILFIIFAVCILIFKRKQKLKTIFYIWIWMFLFLWIRNTIAYTYILAQWLSEFKEKREFYDIWDYIWFIEKVRDKLDLDSQKVTRDNCKIFINEYRHRAIEQHWKLYLIPCEVVSTWELADYKIYYKTEIPVEDSNKKILVNFNGSYLLDNNSK